MVQFIQKWCASTETPYRCVSLALPNGYPETPITAHLVLFHSNISSLHFLGNCKEREVEKQRTPAASRERVEVVGSSKPMIATQAEMVEHKVPIPYRDQCAHLLIPLNKCRVSDFYLPWKCENKRHAYEKCEYELVMERMLKMQKIREEEKIKQQRKQKQEIPLIPTTANA